MLTEAVDEVATNAVADGPFDDLDDVPVLTDAVEEIDVGIVEEARGEPSLWDLTSRGEASVLGPAPDSIIVVPPPDTGPPWRAADAARAGTRSARTRPATAGLRAARRAVRPPRRRSESTTPSKRCPSAAGPRGR